MPALRRSPRQKDGSPPPLTLVPLHERQPMTTRNIIEEILEKESWGPFSGKGSTNGYNSQLVPFLKWLIKVNGSSQSFILPQPSPNYLLNTLYSHFTYLSVLYLDRTLTSPVSSTYAVASLEIATTSWSPSSLKTRMSHSLTLIFLEWSLSGTWSIVHFSGTVTMSTFTTWIFWILKSFRAIRAAHSSSAKV